MRAHGHDVVSFGKLHHRSAADDDGFSERVQPMFIAGGVGWLQGLPRRDPLPYPEAAELAQETGSGETTYTRYDARITDAAVDWLSTRTDDDPPWVAFVSLVAPHYPLSAPDEFTNRIPLADVPPPEIDRIEPQHPAVAAMRRFFDYDASFDAAHTQEARRAYFALCSWMDHNVGQVLRALDTSGQRDDTLVVYTSDHGELLGNRGLWAKSFMYEDSVAVPMIVSGPGVPGGRVVDGSFAVRSGDWKYVHHVGYRPELYNVHDDPNELDDLGESATTRIEREQAEELLRSIVDPDAADRQAFDSQAALIDAHGGLEAIRSAFRFNHTPAPGG